MAGEYDLPDDKWLAEKIRQIEHDLAELKSARPMMATSMEGGTFRLVSPQTNRALLTYGQFHNPDLDIFFGVSQNDRDGTYIGFYDDEDRGIVYPHDAHQWIVPTSQTITSGTFVAVAECELIEVAHDTICADGAIQVAAATTAEVRIADPTGTYATDAVLIPASANGNATFEWIHPFTVGWGDQTGPTVAQVVLQWQVRRVSGVGNVTAYPPRHLTLRNQGFTPRASSSGGGRFA